MKVFAAIDIGSNAIRMLIGNIHKGKLNHLKKIRIPVRLGADVFSTGSIKLETLNELKDSFKTFKKTLMDYQVEKVRAVATSSVRNSKNKEEMEKLIKKHLDIKLEIIDGRKEAMFVHQAIKKALDISRKSVIMIDIGGGSVEIAHSNKGDFQKIISLPLGTLRSLAQLGTDQYEGFQKFVDKFRPDVQKFFKEIKTSPSIAVGAGGCLDCLKNLKKKMVNSKACDRISNEELHIITKKLVSMGYEKRIKDLALHPHRADVIVQACYICKMIMEVCNCETIVLPGVGLKEGLLWEMFEKEI